MYCTLCSPSIRCCSNFYARTYGNFEFMCALIFGNRFPQALDEMIETADGRPVHGIYLCEERPRRRIFDFFDDLAAATGGSVRCFVLVRSGAQSELCPVHCDRGLVFQRSNKEITRVSVR